MKKKNEKTTGNKIGSAIRNRRCSLGMSQEDVAVLISRRRESVSHYENGKLKVSLDLLKDISKALKYKSVPAEWLSDDNFAEWLSDENNKENRISKELSNLSNQIKGLTKEVARLSGIIDKG